MTLLYADRDTCVYAVSCPRCGEGMEFHLDGHRRDCDGWIWNDRWAGECPRCGVDLDGVRPVGVPS